MIRRHEFESYRTLVNFNQELTFFSVFSAESIDILMLLTLPREIGLFASFISFIIIVLEKLRCKKLWTMPLRFGLNGGLPMLVHVFEPESPFSVTNSF